MLDHQNLLSAGDVRENIKVVYAALRDVLSVRHSEDMEMSDEIVLYPSGESLPSLNCSAIVNLGRTPADFGGGRETNHGRAKTYLEVTINGQTYHAFAEYSTSEGTNQVAVFQFVSGLPYLIDEIDETQFRQLHRRMAAPELILDI